MKLNYKKFGNGEPLIILHGLFGSLDNWQTLAKKFAENYEVFILDARNHGFSPHKNEFNYEVMADDVYEFIIKNSIINPAILGHSMGGKTAMQFAMNYPNKLSKLIVADIAPKSYPVYHEKIIEGMETLDFNKINTRKKADEELAKYIPEIAVRQFILKNLHWKEKGKLAWKFNLPVIKKNINLVGHELNNIQPFNKPTLFIRGSYSNYILPTDYQDIKEIFPLADIQTLDAAHWVHAEKQKDFFEVVSNFLS